MHRSNFQIVAAIVTVAFAIRLSGIALTFFGMNPFAGGQVPHHVTAAEQFALDYRQFEFTVDLTSGSAFDRWPPLLAVFWLLPGPSALYAQLTMALLGALAIGNVYLIAHHFHSRRAGVLAALPLALFPSYVFMHSVVQREAFILLLLTSAVVLVFLPNRHVPAPWNYALALGCVLLAGHVRIQTLPVLLLAITMVALTKALTVSQVSRNHRVALTGVLAVVSAVVTMASTRLILDSPRDIVAYFRELRTSRANGRALYHTDILPTTLLDLILYAPIGMVYFLLMPFPWYLELPRDVVAGAESLIGLVFLVFAVYGVLVLARKSLPLAVGIVTLVLVFSLLFGLGTVNYGTGIRHRQTVFWAIFILGALGFCEYRTPTNSS